MRQIITISLALLAFTALVHLVAGQGIPATGTRRFGYTSFKATDELDFGVEFNPTFGPENLRLMFYDPLGGEERIEVGAVWFKRRAHLESFNVTFTIRMSNLSHTGVGNPDGFALVVQNHRPNSFGAGAGGIGYGTTPDYDDLGVRRSVAVEFDTYLDESLGDPNSNHISVHHTTNDRVHNSAHEDAAINPPGAVIDVPAIAGFTHKYNIQYIEKQLSVYMDDSATPVYQTTIDIPQILALNTSGAFIGLTAACMSTCEDVDVLNWHFNYVATFDASKSYATNVRNSTVAGRTTTFTVQGVDTNGYFFQTGGETSRFAVSLTPVANSGAVAVPPVSISDRGDGTYLFSYAPTTAGLYDVTVSHNGVQLAGMPLRLSVTPAVIDPTKSEISGNVNGGVAGQLQNITILGRDAFNNINLNNNPAAVFTATFNPGGVSASSTFIGNGTYLIQYSLNTARSYVMTVTYNGTVQHVRGSPFNAVTITPALPEPSASIASGNGIVGGTAGSTHVATVLLRDRFQNNITSNHPAGYQLIGIWDKPVAGNNVTFTIQPDGTLAGSYAINTAGSYRLTIVMTPSGQPIFGSPFPVTVTPQTITSAAQSVATGPGLTTASAGGNATFTVQARDTFGNNMLSSDAAIAVSFSDDSGVPLQIASSAAQNAADKSQFIVSYVPTNALTTRIAVTLNGSPIKGSPFIVSVHPGTLDPKNCFAEGLGLVTPKTKVPLSFIVITADHFNNRLKTGGATIDVTLKEMKSGATVAGSVQDMNNGAYNVGFTLTRSGTYNITITANGVAIGKDTKYSMVVPNEGLGALGWALIVLAILALIAVVGGGAFWYLKYYKARSDYDEIGA
jgi:hypothetical protein